MIQPQSNVANKWIAPLFYGNYFYGICVVAMMLEITVQLQLEHPDPVIYGIGFVGTVLFYNYPYARRYKPSAHDPRTMWYYRNRKTIRVTQLLFTVLVVAGLAWFLVRYRAGFAARPVTDWCLLLLFPLAGALYYGANFLSFHYNLRQIGWLKPFLIGFVWAGCVTVCPVLLNDIAHGQPFVITGKLVLLTVKNFMFVSVLAILFDIKDYAGDARRNLHTIVVRLGLRRTLFQLVAPLVLLGVITFASYATIQHFSILKMTLIMIPFILLLLALRLLRQRRSLLFYLIVIDGLMLVKALFDILAELLARR